MSSLRLWIAQQLRRIAAWIDIERSDSLLALTREYVQMQEDVDASGEWKRHQVYAKLIKAFPTQRKRDLAFAIERVMQEF